MSHMFLRSFGFVILLFIFWSCNKEKNLVEDNVPYATFNISNIKIENYIHRLYIDIIGREPINEELEAEVKWLKDNDINRESRDSIIRKLMTDTTFKENEFSYKAAYFQNLYNLAKIRCIEGVSDGEISKRIKLTEGRAYRDSLLENWDGFYEAQVIIRSYQLLLDSRVVLYNGKMQYHTMFSFMVNNGLYDDINMNSFNFIRATMDQLLWRLPTETEYPKAFDMVEHGETRVFMNKTGGNKKDYINIITESTGMFEGMIIWAYQVFLNRAPSAKEMVSLMPEYTSNKIIDSVIAKILVTDEYANFK